MKKILILLSAMLCAALAGQAADSFVISDCGHKIAGGSGHGSDSAGEIAAAVYVPASGLKTLAGNSISRIDIGLISRINVRDITVWVRRDIDGANLAEAFVERGKVGWNEIELPSPYMIEEGCSGLYVGFSYQNTGSSHPVSFVGKAGALTPYLRTESGGKWTDMTAEGALSLEVVVTGDRLPLYDISLDSASVYPDISAGDGVYAISGTVSNKALRTITGFNVAVTADGESSEPASVDISLAPGETASFKTGVKVQGLLEGDVTVSITSLADGSDADTDNNSCVAAVRFPRNVVLEEFTTEKCSNCPEAASYISNILDSNEYLRERVFPVCHHAGFYTDWLTRECDTDLLWMYDLDGQSFAPAMMFDRQPIFRLGLAQDRYEPIVAPRDEATVADCITKALEIPAHAMVGIVVNSVSDDTDNGNSVADITVTVIADDELDLPSPRLTLYTVEDRVPARLQEGTDDKNYMHNHVIRTDNGTWGEEISFDENTFTGRYSITIQPDWNRDNISFVAFLHNRDEESVNGNRIENSAMVRLTTDITDSVGVVSADAVESARYDINGVRVTKPVKGLNIVVYSDGSVKKVFRL